MPNHGNNPNFMTARNPSSQIPPNSLPSRQTNNQSNQNNSNGGMNANPNNGPGNCNANPNNQSTTTLQMKQTQQLHINQHGPNSPNIHVIQQFI